MEVQLTMPSAQMEIQPLLSKLWAVLLITMLTFQILAMCSQWACLVADPRSLSTHVCIVWDPFDCVVNLWFWNIMCVLYCIVLIGSFLVYMVHVMISHCQCMRGSSWFPSSCWWLFVCSTESSKTLSWNDSSSHHSMNTWNSNFTVCMNDKLFDNQCHRELPLSCIYASVVCAVAPLDVYRTSSAQ